MSPSSISSDQDKAASDSDIGYTEMFGRILV